VIVYDEEIPLRYRALDFIHLTHDGHAMIAAALLPRVMAILDRRRSDVLPSQSPTGVDFSDRARLRWHEQLLSSWLRERCPLRGCLNCKNVTPRGISC
jgi:hypothetical protein